MASVECLGQGRAARAAAQGTQDIKKKKKEKVNPHDSLLR